MKKLDDRTTVIVFVDYEDGVMAYRIYNPRTKRLYITREVVFK